MPCFLLRSTWFEGREGGCAVDVYVCVCVRACVCMYVAMHELKGWVNMVAHVQLCVCVRVRACLCVHICVCGSLFTVLTWLMLKITLMAQVWSWLSDCGGMSIE